MLKKILIIILIVITIWFVINLYNQQEYFVPNIKSDVKLVTGPTQKVPTNDSSIPQLDLAGAIPLDFDFKDYYRTLADENKDLVYYYPDEIDQAKYVETAFNVVNQIDLTDYANVKTGLQKCQENCKGVCFEGGYTGTATCYPMLNRTFDWGTLYKNPTFTYGYNAWDNLDNIVPG